tara:strand:+ start:121 stop:408 length:288 start_codon:yes stop_codon:yes gene_type:complete
LATHLLVVKERQYGYDGASCIRGSDQSFGPGMAREEVIKARCADELTVQASQRGANHFVKHRVPSQDIGRVDTREVGQNPFKRSEVLVAKANYGG